MFQVFKSLKAKRQAKLFERLVAPHFESLYRLAYYLTGTEDNAQDLVQDLLTKLYPKTFEMQSVEKLKPWLAKSLTYCFIDEKRKSSRSPITLIDRDESLEELHVETKADPQFLLEQGQSIETIQLAFDRLSEEHKVVLLLHDIEGYSLPELQTMLELPLGTLKSRIHRARNRLQNILSPKAEPFAQKSRVNE